MNPIRQSIAQSIALAYREISVAEDLLKQISPEAERREGIDIRDAFGRPHKGLQLGVPSGESSHRLYNVPWSMARPIIEAHIFQQRALVATLTEQAAIEMYGVPIPIPEGE